MPPNSKSKEQRPGSLEDAVSEPKAIGLAPRWYALPGHERVAARRRVLPRVPDGNPYSADFREKADLWGITEAATRVT